MYFRLSYKDSITRLGKTNKLKWIWTSTADLTSQYKLIFPSSIIFKSSNQRSGRNSRHRFWSLPAIIYKPRWRLSSNWLNSSFKKLNFTGCRMIMSNCTLCCSTMSKRYTNLKFTNKNLLSIINLILTNLRGNWLFIIRKFIKKKLIIKQRG